MFSMAGVRNVNASTACTRLLICRVGRDRLAFDASDIREVLPLIPLWRPPTLPPPLVGFVRLDGEVVPVLAPGVLFGQTSTPENIDLFAHLLRPHGVGGRMPCLLVDRCEEMISVEGIAVRAIEPGASHNGVVVGEVPLADGVAHLLSLERLLDEGERVRMEALTEEAQRRAREWAAG